MRVARNSSWRRWRAALVAVAMAALPAAVSAHLFWPTFHSAKSAISIDAEKGLQAAVVIEVPTFELLARFKEHYADLDLLKEIEAGRFDELETKFRDIQFESFAKATLARARRQAGGRHAGGRSTTPINGKGTEGFFVYMLEFAFTAPPQLGKRVAVRLENKALPDAQVVMANVAEANGGWRVAESSIPPPEKYPDLPEGAQYADDIALWSIDPVKRDLRVTFERE